jgi:hypothetical protein
MSYIINKIGILKDAFMGNLMKVKVLYDIRIRKNITLSPVKDDSTIVSLTSYGKRVNGSALYTIYSLLKQNIRPDRVVLWLNEDEYNDDNITSDIRFLFDYGLDVRYAKDIRSYTKIIHSLKMFPDKHIITADDDIYYTKNFVEEFVNAHRLHPKAIITGFAKDPILDTNNNLKTYSDWPEYHHVPASFEYDKMKILPLGWAGVFYPSHVFDEEVTNEAVFTTLCPKADDIWLYIMGIRSGAEKRFLSASRISYYQTDLLRQYLTRDRLTATNRLKLKNDTQLKALLAHYKIPIKDITIDI